MMAKDYSLSYQRMVETRKERQGEDVYVELGKKAEVRNFEDKSKAKMAAMKRWHPEYFDDSGKMKKQFEVILRNKGEIQ